MRRPQARSRRGRRRRRAALDHDFDPLPLSRSFPLPLSRSFPLPLDSSSAAASRSSRSRASRASSASSTAPERRGPRRTRRRRQQRRTAERARSTKQRRIGDHPINRTPPNARNPAVKPTHNFVPLDEDKQTHPLMRRIQDRRIAPGQPPQILAIHAEFLRSLNDVAEVLAQSARRSLVAKMRKRCRPPRKHRHQRLTRLGQLGLQSGPRPPRRLKIRLITGIDNGFSFPRRSPAEPHETQHSRNAASSRERRSIVPHKVDGLSRNDSLLSNMARSFGMRCSARCLTLIGSARCRTPRRLQQPATNHIAVEQPQHPAPTCRTSGTRTTTSRRRSEISATARRRSARRRRAGRGTSSSQP